MNRELRQIGMVAGVLLFVGLWGAGSAHAAVIGSDTFDYTDGNVAGHSPPLDGGVGWAWMNSTQTQTSGKSAWYNARSNRTPYINTGGMYSTNDSTAMRTFSNPEADGSVTGGRVYLGVALTRTVAPTGGDWAGMCLYSTSSRATQAVFFGSPWTGTTFGIVNGGGASLATSTIPFVTNQTYRIVAVLDYVGNEVRMWVNPDGTDYDNGAGMNSADLVGAYTPTPIPANAAVGFNSGMTARWDDLVVSTDPVSVGLNVPEPASLVLLGLGGLVCIRRRR